MDQSEEARLDEVLDVTTQIGHIMLENGAEIFRVEESMERISHHFGIDNSHFFVLSNGILTSGGMNYSNMDFIPIKGTQLEKVVAANDLSRGIVEGRYTLAQARQQIERIKAMPPKPNLLQVLATAIGSSSFCAIFGGDLLDCTASAFAGMALWIFILWTGTSRLSKISSNILGSLIAGTCCLIFQRLGFGHHLANMIIGATIPLFPGVSFTNGIRDLANEDYIAGSTRMLDAMTIFFSIAAGTALAFILDSKIEGSMMILDKMQVDSITALWPIQIAAGFLGTAAFAIVFGAPAREYAATGICGMAGWIVYLLLMRNTQATVFESNLIASMAITFTSRLMAVRRKCPVIVYQICGILPLVPGAGIFWTSYYLVTQEFGKALTNGVSALAITLAIVMGIILINAIPGKFFKTVSRRD